MLSVVAPREGFRRQIPLSLSSINFLDLQIGDEKVRRNGKFIVISNSLLFLAFSLHHSYVVSFVVHR